MILEDFALNIAAGLAQWLIEPQLDDWRRRLHDPQRDAITKVFESAARQMLRILTSDLQYARPDLGPGDYEVLGEVLEDFFALEPVRVAVLDAAITGRPLDPERMRTRFGTIRGSDPGIVVPLERCLTQFCTHLGSGIYSAAQDMDSPVHNFWSVLVAGNMQRLAWGIANTVQETQSGIAELRRLLMQALEQSSAPPAPLWVNVPPQPNLILGRGDLLTELVNRLIAGDNPALSADGLPGVGKTTLAVLLAYDARVREHFRDGVLWAGLGRQADVATVQATWAEALGVDLGDLGDLGQRQERISRALAGRRVLVVLDDAWDAAVADGLRCSGPYVRHVLTTRDEGIARSFAGAAQVFKVPVFDGDTAWTFLQKLAPEMCAAEPVAARALADSVGGLPLAVELLGGYLAAPQRSQFAGQRKRALVAVATPAERLALATRRLGDKAGVLQTLEAVIRLSVDDLAESAPEAASAFWALGAFAPKPATFALAAALAVTGANEDVLALLAERNLIEVGAGDWLAVHQVVHDVMATETPEEAAAAQARHYAQAMSAANDEQRYHVMLPALPQLRFAFAWAIEQDLDLALDIAISSAQLQKQFNLVREGGDWSERLLEAVWSRDVASETLARAFGHRAGVLCAIATLPGEDRGKRLLEALAAYDDALQYRRSDVAPLAYALTQSNRGSVLSEIATLSGEDRGKRLLEALAACDDALQYRRSDAAPLAYAATQHNRANLLSEIATLPGEDRGKRLLEALAAYDDALQYRRSEVVPLDYAMTQSNRGLLLSAIATLPGEERRERLLQALDACDDSLKYRKPELAPLDYADNQINRGLVLSEIASLPGEDRGERLLESLAAYDDALQYRRSEVVPLDCATTQYNRGLLLSAIATLPGEDRRKRLLQALAAYDDALQYYRPEIAPLVYAMAQGNLANLYMLLSELAGEDRRSRQLQSVQSAVLALGFFEQVGHDVYVVQARKQIAYLRRRFGVDVFSSLWSELWSELGFGDLPAWLADDPSE